MKVLCGILGFLLSAVGFVSMLATPIGMLILTVLVIVDAINLFKSPDPVVFMDVFWLVLLWIGRELLAVLAFIVSWVVMLLGGGMMSYAGSK